MVLLDIKMPRASGSVESFFKWQKQPFRGDMLPHKYISVAINGLWGADEERMLRHSSGYRCESQNSCVLSSSHCS